MGDCHNALEDVCDSELLVLSLGHAVDAIGVLQRFGGPHEGAKRAVHALAEFESQAQPLMCKHTGKNHRLFQKLKKFGRVT